MNGFIFYQCIQTDFVSATFPDIVSRFRINEAIVTLLFSTGRPINSFPEELI